MDLKPSYYNQKYFQGRGFWIEFVCAITLMVAIMIGSALFEQAHGQNTDEALGEELKQILQKQQLPSEYENLPYLSYASLSGALWAYKEMPKPTYIVPKRMMFSLSGNEKDGKYVTLYRVYFTPKPGTEYNVPKGKTVRYDKAASLPGGDGYALIGSGWGIGFSQMRATHQNDVLLVSAAGTGYASWRSYHDYWQRSRPWTFQQ